MRRHHFDLLLNLIRKDLRVRYMGSALGYLWSLGAPLVTVLVYWFVFSRIFTPPVKDFALYIVTGVVHWILLAQILTASCEWFTGNAALLRKVSFPKLLLPVAGGGAIFMAWLSSLLVVAIAWRPLGGHFGEALFLYPLVLCTFMAFAMGAGMVLAVLNVDFRDTRHLLDVALPLLFWMTPIIWVPEQLPQDIAHWLALNPLGAFFRSFSTILHQGVVPSNADLLMCVGAGSIALCCGQILLAAREYDLVERL
ncbi:ABC transporter permease [Variovorax sp. VNK109]|jgi:lipopolysaccharide transport system permease protein|uniref:ABC transporter permease n=1 Tax=Variovorax sp. VNK109 TaxID=3400919 RepID=UPI003C12A9CE